MAAAVARASSLRYLEARKPPNLKLNDNSNIQIKIYPIIATSTYKCGTSLLLIESENKKSKMFHQIIVIYFVFALFGAVNAYTLLPSTRLCTKSNMCKLSQPSIQISSKPLFATRLSSTGLPLEPYTFSPF